MRWQSIENHVLSLYPDAVPVWQVQPLGSTGGFSGALLWRLECSAGTLGLRAWPVGSPEPRRLAWTHGVLSFLHDHGYRLVPKPLVTSQGATFLAWQGRLWQLSPWLQGHADYRRAASDRKLQSALRALAELHRLAALVPTAPPLNAPSPALQKRHAFMQELRDGLLDNLKEALRRPQPPELVARGHVLVAQYQALAPEVFLRVSAARNADFTLQVCHGDLWHDHVLFRDDHVSGLIDFGAMKVESRTIDVARLLGSLACDDRLQWQRGLEAYQELLPLGPQERQLLQLLDQTNVLLSGLSWLRWLLLEGRHFDHPERIYERLDEFTQRLRCLARGESGSSVAWPRDGE